MILLLQSPGYALGLLFGLTVVLHAALVWARPQSAVFWKRSDYVWLTLASVGLLSGTGDVRRFISGHAIDLQAARTAFDFKFLKDHVEAAEAVYCRAVQRGPKPSGSVDEGERDRVQLCRWYGEIRRQLPDKVGPDYPLITLPEAVKPGTGMESQSAQASVRKILRSYEDGRVEMLRVREGTQRTELDSLLLALGPLALIAGLALRLTKATAEVRIERDRRRSRRIFAREDEE
jgi:hypothetical protein